MIRPALKLRALDGLKIPPLGKRAEAGGVVSTSALSDGDAMQATSVGQVGDFKFSNKHITRISKHYLALDLIGIKGEVQYCDW